MTKLIVALRSFANASKNDWSCGPPPILCFCFVDGGFTSLFLIHYFDSLFCIRVASFVFDAPLFNPSIRNDEYTLFPRKERESNISTMR
jgi:hypothetical protein